MGQRNRVVVVGSGAAGMAASLAAAAEGAEVTVVEAAPALGGTSAISGGGIWIPANRFAAAAGVEDSPDAGLRYLRALELGDSDRSLAECYVLEGPRVTGAIEERSPLRWQHLVGFPDYHAELDGGSRLGRSLEIGPVHVEHELLSQVRPDPHGVPPITINEEAAGEGVDADELERRRHDGIATRGRGLIAGLLAAMRELGGRVVVGTRAASLTMSKGAVTGLEAEGGRLPGRVILASGGFEREPALVRSFLRGPLVAPAGPPSNRGDGLRMGMAAGAALGNMSEAWWSPAMEVPGAQIDAEPLYRMLFLDVAKPGSILVDSSGRRFANEATNYNDLGRALHAFDEARYRFPRVPSWLVFDRERRSTDVGAVRAGERDPDWLPRAGSLEQLADLIGVPPGNLCEAVEEFNGHVRRGIDRDFGRGSYVWDRFSAGTDGLRPVAEPPFYALRVLPGCLGTKGGLKTDKAGRVLRADGTGVIPGLYAAGNAAANPFGCAYPGPGATIGPALVFGWLAGEAAASQ
jgi:succinate dehydrogenase/fumarate reductase flavoprotein subunit